MYPSNKFWNKKYIYSLYLVTDRIFVSFYVREEKILRCLISPCGRWCSTKGMRKVFAAGKQVGKLLRTAREQVILRRQKTLASYKRHGHSVTEVGSWKTRNRKMFERVWYKKVLQEKAWTHSFFPRSKQAAALTRNTTYQQQHTGRKVYFFPHTRA